MLSELEISNFTAFASAKFEFSPGLNVLVGANGAGESHILKLGYSLSASSFELGQQKNRSIDGFRKSVVKDLSEIFMVEQFGNLARFHSGSSPAKVSVNFSNADNAGYSFSFSSRSVSDIKLTGVPTESALNWPIYIPAKELLSNFPGLVGLFKSYKLSIDRTFVDLCERLDQPLMRGEQYEAIRPICEALEKAVGGKISNENGRFYFYTDKNNRLEIDLVAEGFRKISTLGYLLANGSLTNTSPLFWDEPEANLNPLLVKELAGILMLLAKQKYQIIIGTHSLFLLKELYILSKEDMENKVSFLAFLRREVKQLL